MLQVLSKSYRIMSRNGLSPEAVSKLKVIHKKLDAIRVETRTFMEQKDGEISSLQSQIKELIGSKRPLIEETEEKYSKKTKSDTFSEKNLQKHKFNIEDGFVQVYTDGACPNNGQQGARAGLGVWWGHGHALNLSQRVSGNKQTNNAGEIQAVIMAITQATSVDDVKKLQINTDSQFVINSVTQWMKGWKQKGWVTASGQEVKNKDDFQVLDKLIGNASDRGVEIRWKYVKGHSNVEGNVEADRLAVLGAQMKS